MMPINFSSSCCEVSNVRATDLKIESESKVVVTFGYTYESLLTDKYGSNLCENAYLNDFKFAASPTMKCACDHVDDSIPSNTKGMPRPQKISHS